MSGKPVLVSIDTEGPCGCNGVDKLIWGRTVDGVEVRALGKFFSI